MNGYVAVVRTPKNCAELFSKHFKKEDPEGRRERYNMLIWGKHGEFYRFQRYFGENLNSRI